MAYRRLNNALETAMSETLSSWREQDERKIQQPTEITSLLKAFMAMISAYLARISGSYVEPPSPEFPPKEDSRMVATGA